MNFSETLTVDGRQLAALRKLVKEGEHLRLEFKRKAAYPDKLVREIIAFANTEGGVLLIGVDDDGSIPGVKYPEEELVVLRKALAAHCRPAIDYQESIIPISEKRFVVRFDITAEGNRPHFFVPDKGPRECFVRVRDMSVKASDEVTEIVKRSARPRNIRFTFGEAEKKLMEYLEQNKTITLDGLQGIAGINRYMAARKLILLVLANVLKVVPGEKGDVYCRV